MFCNPNEKFNLAWLQSDSSESSDYGLSISLCRKLGPVACMFVSLLGSCCCLSYWNCLNYSYLKLWELMCLPLVNYVDPLANFLCNNSDFQLIIKYRLLLLVLKCWQWEALALLLIGISINQLKTVPAGNTAFGLPVTAIAYIYTLIFVSC
jgi:hypothetical protein